MEEEYILYDPRSSSKHIKIEKNEYEMLKNAKSQLLIYLYMEEKLNFVIENYIELEREILDISISNLVTPLMSIEWTQYVNEIHKINRRIINLLTASRMYLDSVVHDLKMVCSDKLDVVTMFNKLKNIEYDAVIGYRVMEALRNYVQHRGLPIHVISHKTSKTDDDRIKHLIVPILRVKDLESDGKFKNTVLDELKQIGDKVDIRLYLRQYIQSFYKFQKFIRDILSDDMKRNDEIFIKYFSLYEEKYGNTLSLAVSQYYYNKFLRDTAHILTDIIKRRKWLETKNSIDKDLTINFVTGEL